MKHKVTLITSFFNSVLHPNRAPYNDQLFFHLNDQIDLNVICPLPWTEVLRAKKQGKELPAFNRTLNWKGIPVAHPIYFSIPLVGHLINGLLYYLSFGPSFKRMNPRNPELIYSSWAYPDAYASMLLARKNNLPLIMRVHGSDVNVLLSRRDMREKILEMFAYASAIVSPSLALKNVIVEAGIPEDKIHVIYSGVDKSKFFPTNKSACIEKLGLKKDVKRIIYVGNLKVAKGITDLLQAIAILKEQRSNFELVVIGKGEDLAEVEQIIKDRKLAAHVKLVGEMPHSKLNDWMNASDCLCLPSHAEGMPNVILEAFATGISVVATDVGGISEVLSAEGDNLMKPRDVSKIAKALQHALFERKQTMVPMFNIESYDEVSQRVLSLIDQVCDAKKK
ncbi:MAG: glycosyltransferase [Pseudomonadales bacterium]|nr:glycosyltransferase [Pseudomonadales bacterium]